MVWEMKNKTFYYKNKEIFTCVFFDSVDLDDDKTYFSGVKFLNDKLNKYNCTDEEFDIVYDEKLNTLIHEPTNINLLKIIESKTDKKKTDKNKIICFCNNVERALIELHCGKFEITAVSASISDDLDSYYSWIEDSGLKNRKINSVKIEEVNDENEIIEFFKLTDFYDKVEKNITSESTLMKFKPSRFLFKEKVLENYVKYIYELHSSDLFMYFLEVPINVDNIETYNTEDWN